MNRNLKKIIAIAIVLGSISAVAPATCANLLTIKAYASDSDADELTGLELETSNGGSLDIYTDSGYDDKLDDDLSVGDTYYSKTSSNKIVINSIDGADDDSVRIFKESSSKAYEVGDNISISEGTTTILKVRVYEDKYDDDENYSSSDYNQYTIIVKNTTSDDADLLGLSLSNGVVNFDQNTNSYTTNVPNDAASTIVQAIPQDTDDTVTIDGITVDSDGGYKRTVPLSSTANTITVKVLKDNSSRTYTLTVNKTLNSEAGQQGNQPANGSQGASNGNWQAGWQKINGLWFYFDNNGQKKTGWMKDTDGKYYYLNSDGSMAHDTIIDGYELGSDGAWKQNNNGSQGGNNSNVQAGWQKINGLWFYFDNNGQKRTGWIKDTDEKYYYLNSDGSMAHDTTVDGYELGSDGAWKQNSNGGQDDNNNVQVGWQKINGSWFYLDNNGQKRTGWIKDTDGKYYYLNSDGSMAHDTTIGSYKVGSDGAWIQ